jgi:phosphohistidine phosphatase
MKVLYLLRHAEAERCSAGGADFDRRLSAHGERDARLVGTFMREKGISPDAVVSSPARRARQTAELVAETAGLHAPVRFEARIYEAHPLDLMKIVCAANAGIGWMLIVGHNPGLETLLERLTVAQMGLATAAFARIDLDVPTWAEVDVGRGQLGWVVSPGGIEAGIGGRGA